MDEDNMDDQRTQTVLSDEEEVEKYLVNLNYKELDYLRTKFLKFCTYCNSSKPPKAHHCRQCDSCVMRMDHHCPWVGNCIGSRNLKQFVLFNFYVLILSIVVFFDLSYRGLMCLVLHQNKVNDNG